MGRKPCRREGCPNLAVPYCAYCSDACRDTQQRARAKLRKAALASLPKARTAGRYRVYQPGEA